jgi:hypothetical protein
MPLPSAQNPLGIVTSLQDAIALRSFRCPGRGHKLHVYNLLISINSFILPHLGLTVSESLKSWAIVVTYIRSCRTKTPWVSHPGRSIAFGLKHRNSSYSEICKRTPPPPPPQILLQNLQCIDPLVFIFLFFLQVYTKRSTCYA